MLNLFLHELRVNRRGLFALALALFLFAFMMAMMIPSLQEGLEDALKAVPPFLRPLVQQRWQTSGIPGILAIGYSHPVWLTLMGAWAIGYGTRAIAGEIERGTLALTLAYPLSRNHFLVAKMVALVAGLLILIAATILGTLLGLSLQGLGLAAGWAGFLWASLGMSLLFLALGGFAFACSAMMSEGGRALGWALGFAVVSFFLDAIGQLWKTAEPLRPLSVFQYYKPGVLLEGVPPDAAALAFLGGLALAGLLVAWLAFNRRDLSI